MRLRQAGTKSCGGEREVSLDAETKKGRPTRDELELMRAGADARGPAMMDWACAAQACR